MIYVFKMFFFLTLRIFSNSFCKVIVLVKDRQLLIPQRWKIDLRRRNRVKSIIAIRIFWAPTVFSPTVTNVHYDRLSKKYLIWSILKNIGIVLFKSLGICKRRNKRFYLYNVNEAPLNCNFRKPSFL